MTGQQLKNSILQMAVQGKLVPQDPNDEPASVLLERIRAEKEQLIKEGKIKKEKNPSVIFRGADNLPYEKVGKNEPVCIADEVPFDIPESWEWVRHNELFEISGGSQPPKSKFVTEPKRGYVRLYQIRDYGNSPVPVYIPINTASKISKKGDILLARYGASLGKVFWAEDGAYNVAMARVVPLYESELIYKKYLFLFYQSNLYQELIHSNSRSAQAGFNKEDLSKLFLPIPPFKEQLRIVSTYENLQPYIADYEIAGNHLRNLNMDFPTNLKKSILQYAIQGKLVPQDPADEPASVLLEHIRAEKEQLIKAGKIKRDKHESVIFRRDNSYYEISGKEEVCIDDEIPFEIPDSWVWVRLGTALSQASTGPFGSMVHKEDYVESGIPIVNPANIIHGNISSEKIKKVSNATANRLSSYKLKTFDIIIGRRGEMGRSAVVESHQEGWLCGTGCFFVTPSKLLLPQYLVFLLNSPFVKAALTKNSVGTTMNNLNHNILQSLLIPVPPINEQKKIMTNYQESTVILDG